MMNSQNLGIRLNVWKETVIYGDAETSWALGGLAEGEGCILLPPGESVRLPSGPYAAAR